MANILGKLEQKIMSMLWDCDTPYKTSEIKSKLGGEYAYTTINTILGRLHNKGLLERTKRKNTYYYFACKKKEKFAKPKLRQVFEHLINSYGEIAISQFIDSMDKNPEQLKLLKKYLNDKKD